MKAAIWRLVRVLVAQIPALIAYLNGVGSPVWVMVGAVINAVAKYVRDKYKLDWIPV